MSLEHHIIKRVKDTPPSGIRKYFDLVNEMEGVISLGIGEPDFVTPYNIIEEGIDSLEKGHTHYSSNAGYIELREEIAKYMERKYSLKYEPADEVLVTVGASEGIDVLLRCIIEPGDEVIIPEPSFVAYKGCTNFVGGKVVSIPLKEENDFKLTLEELEQNFTDKTKAIIFPFPCNPTGAIMGKEDMDKLVDFLASKDVVIISDEIYAELTYGDTPHVSIASYDKLKDKTVVINGFSKSYAMTGWRLGYACGPKEIIAAMKKIHQYAIMCAPTTAQFAAIEALKNGDSSIEEMKKVYNRRRRIMVKSFRKMGLSCFEPLGAFYAFPNISSLGISSDEFCDRLLREEKVLAIPGNTFGDSGEGFIRATYANSDENILEALSRIERFVNKLKNS